MTYFIEPEQLDSLRRVASTLHAGTDAMRDLGHRVWYVVTGVAENQKLTDKVSDCFVQKPAANKELADRFYTTGMHLADCLRLMGKHDDSREVEVWILETCKEYMK
jgi:hypothetical protein